MKAAVFMIHQVTLINEIRLSKISNCLLLAEILEEPAPRPFVQFAKDGYKKQLENKLNELSNDLEMTQLKKSGGTRTKKLKHLNNEIEKIKKELFSLEGFNSFIDKSESQLNSISNDTSQLNSGKILFKLLNLRQ